MSGVPVVHFRWFGYGQDGPKDDRIATPGVGLVRTSTRYVDKFISRRNVTKNRYHVEEEIERVHLWEWMKVNESAIGSECCARVWMIG